MLTVPSLLAECGLELLPSSTASEEPVRWVHITEHEDPTPWLSGGELILTTGYNLDDETKQRAYVKALAASGVAGLGFGTGFDHKSIPEPIVAAASASRMPLFEVPYEMPFIAITERAAARLINESYDALERGSKIHERLERIVIEGGGLREVTASIAAAVGGGALVLDGAGAEVARHPESGLARSEDIEALAADLAARADVSEIQPFAPDALGDRALAVPVPGRRDSPSAGWLVVFAERAPLGEFERLIARQASMVVGLELMRERVVAETERRLAGDLLADSLSGRLDADELESRLRPFGIKGEAAVLIFDIADPGAGVPILEEALTAARAPALVAPRAVAGRSLLCAVVAAADRDPVEIAEVVRPALAAQHPDLRVAASRAMGLGSLRRAFHEARCALEATSLNGGGPKVASHTDLGAFTLLLALQDDDALRLYSDDLLEPISRGEGEYGGELLRSLEAFIESNGNWERAARQLYCHRHTLRYRIRKIEELTGRDLSRATDRIELWLALRARELVR